MVARLNELSNADLAKVFNAVTGQTVSRFTNVETGRKRLGRVLAETNTDLLDAMEMADLDSGRPKVVNASVSNVPAADPELATFDRRHRMDAVNGEAPLTGSPPAPKAGGRLETVLGLLRRDGGATVADICEVTGWLPHTTRAYLSKGGAAGKAATIMSKRVTKASGADRAFTVYSAR